MNYQLLYENLIKHALLQNRVKATNDGLDRHHILPKSVGGTNDKANLVLLTSKEHYLAHKLLVKMYTGDAKKKMIYALWWMSKTRSLGAYSNKTRITSRDYETARKLFIENTPVKDPLRKERFRQNRAAGMYKYDSVSMGKALSNTLNKLTVEEKRERMLKSAMTADHEARVTAIRRGKASSIEILNLDGTHDVIFSDQVLSVLGLTWPQVKYRISAHNGLLLDGKVVKLIHKYTGGNKWKNKK